MQAAAEAMGEVEELREQNEVADRKHRSTTRLVQQLEDQLQSEQQQVPQLQQQLQHERWRAEAYKQEAAEQVRHSCYCISPMSCA